MFVFILINKHGVLPLAAWGTSPKHSALFRPKFSSFVHLPVLSDPVLAVRVVSAYSSGEISEATKGHAILLWTCQYSCSVLQRGGTEKNSV